MDKNILKLIEIVDEMFIINYKKDKTSYITIKKDIMFNDEKWINWNETAELIKKVCAMRERLFGWS